jgi:methionine--tRNA ligase beta chain
LFPKLLEPGAEPSAGALPGSSKSANAQAAVAGKAKKDAEKAEMKAKQAAAAAAKAAAGGAAPVAETAEVSKAPEVATAEVSKTPEAATAEGGGKSDKKAKGEKAAKAPKGEATAAAGADEANEVADVCKLDLRVGRIVEAWPHPDSDKLWVEQIDVGEPSGPRNICSGLRAFYATAAELVGQRVVVVANLKNKKMGGVDSFGMVRSKRLDKGLDKRKTSPTRCVSTASCELHFGPTIRCISFSFLFAAR